MCLLNKKSNKNVVIFEVYPGVVIDGKVQGQEKLPLASKMTTADLANTAATVKQSKLLMVNGKAKTTQ